MYLFVWENEGWSKILMIIVVARNYWYWRCL